MNRAAFDFFADLLRREAGMSLTPEKSYLLESRLLPLAQDRGYADVEALAQQLRRDADNRALCQAVIEAMVTHESSFFRDLRPFDYLKNILLPDLLARDPAEKHLRIWSAACAGGQEVYSIAMMLKEMAAEWKGWKIDLVGTDISRDILRQAEDGRFTQFEVQRGLPVKMLVKYFTQEGDYWRVTGDIKNMVTFRHANLLTPPADLGTFDVIFCRNLLTYLDAAARARVLQNLHRFGKKDSVLFLGDAEGICGLDQFYRSEDAQKGLYRRLA
jgi:chemotaxis protein methyltransferase CheR